MKIERMSAKQFNELYGTNFKEKKNKHNNKKVEIDNKIFDSQSEGNLYYDLKMQLRQGLIKDFRTQVKEELYAYGKHICDYYVDFLVEHNDGSKEYIEHKGQVTKDWRIKYKMLQAKYQNNKDIKVSINWYKAGYKINKV